MEIQTERAHCAVANYSSVYVFVCFFSVLSFYSMIQSFVELFMDCKMMYMAINATTVFFCSLRHISNLNINHTLFAIKMLLSKLKCQRKCYSGQYYQLHYYFATAVCDKYKRQFNEGGYVCWMIWRHQTTCGEEKKTKEILSILFQIRRRIDTNKHYIWTHTIYTIRGWKLCSYSIASFRRN